MYRETDYRGQHIIREMIQKKVEELHDPIIKIDVNSEYYTCLWLKACDIIYDDFMAENLTSSANQVLDLKQI